MKIYTKGGDGGTTSLTGGERVPKWDLRVEAYGSVDELMAHVALLGDTLAQLGEPAARQCAELERIVSTLMTVAALFSQGKGAKELADLALCRTAWLEERIDAISATLSPLGSFTLPGGHPAVSLTHICRTVCRRAERAALRADAQSGLSRNALIYLNRLSDYFYALGRELTQLLDVKERIWRMDDR
ncbi:ATP--cob(I)alamin adenosyltransferase [Bacteroidia bacterium]|nr:ATP--cob(I)alamin adenosyltransferase [Bacteroidia bacterium]